MIIDFLVKNYRSIKEEAYLTFRADKSKDLEDYLVIDSYEKYRILKIGVIYGANASGKTTVLKAINELRNIILSPFETKTEQFRFKPFLFDEETKNKDTEFSLEFFASKTRYFYSLKINREYISEESLHIYNPKKALLFARTTDPEKQLVKIRFGNKLKLKKSDKSLLEGSTLWNNTVLGRYLKANIETKELRDVTNWFYNSLLDIITPRTDLISYVSKKIEKNEIKKEIIIDILNKSDLSISNIIYAAKEIKDKKILNILKDIFQEDELAKIKEKGFRFKRIEFEHIINNRTYTLDLFEESAGTQRYYELAGILAMLLDNNKIMLIDELESSLHPDLIKYFYLLFIYNSKNSQLIFTTHYREFLLEKDIFRNDTIWFTEKNQDSATELFNLTDFGSDAIRNTSSIYNSYKIGKLGAIPNFDDYYIESSDE